MTNPSVKVSAKHPIAVSQTACKKLNIKKGNRLLADVQDGRMVLIPEDCSNFRN